MWTEPDVEGILINPFHAVNIDKVLCVEHEPMVSKGEWVKANAELIAQMGAEQWLYHLLDILETGGVKS